MKTPAERVMFFETVERGFALQARVTTLVTGLSGLYLVHQMNLWQRFLHAEYWWMHAMVAIWTVFTLVLFVFEPLFLHRRLIEYAPRAPEAAFRLVTGFHWTLLALSLITVAGAVAGSHGYQLFGQLTFCRGNGLRSLAAPCGTWECARSTCWRAWYAGPGR